MFVNMNQSVFFSDVGLRDIGLQASSFWETWSSRRFARSKSVIRLGTNHDLFANISQRIPSRIG